MAILVFIFMIILIIVMIKKMTKTMETASEDIKQEELETVKDTNEPEEKMNREVRK